MHMRILVFFIFIFLQFSAAAQVKELSAVKATAAPKIDGSLDEPVWSTAPVATDFVQNFPVAGTPALTRTEVRILYDDNAVYIGAYLFDDPVLIR